MRITAGVLLIIVAIINIVAGAGYVLGGSAATAVAESAAADESIGAETKKEAAEAKAAGGTLKAFGFGLWVSVVLQIAGAVVLFRRKAKGFAAGVGALTAITEVIGIALIGFGILNLPGLAAAAFTFLGLRSYAHASGGAVTPAGQMQRA